MAQSDTGPSANSAFLILNSAFKLCFFQQNDIHREVVAISAHPDAAAEGAEGIAVVLTAVLLQELLVVNFRVLELVGRVVGG